MRFWVSTWIISATQNNYATVRYQAVGVTTSLKGTCGRRVAGDGNRAKIDALVSCPGDGIFASKVQVRGDEPSSKMTLLMIRGQ